MSCVGHCCRGANQRVRPLLPLLICLLHDKLRCTPLQHAAGTHPHCFLPFSCRKAEAALRGEEGRGALTAVLRELVARRCHMVCQLGAIFRLGPTAGAHIAYVPGGRCLTIWPMRACRG